MIKLFSSKKNNFNLNDLLSKIKEKHELKEPIQKTEYEWNKFAEITIDYLIEEDNNVHLFLNNPKEAERLKFYLTSNIEHQNKNLFLYTLDQGNVIQIQEHLIESEIINIKKNEADNYKKLLKIIQTEGDNLRLLVEKYFNLGKKNNPVNQFNNEINNVLIEILNSQFSNTLLLYKNMPEREKKKLNETKDDIIIFNSLSGRENFKKGIDNFSLIIGRSSFNEHFKEHIIKSGIVFNLANGQYYFSNMQTGTTFFDGEKSKIILPESKSHFYIGTTPVKIINRNDKFDEDYIKNNKIFLCYLDSLQKFGNNNIKFEKEHSLGLSLVEDHNKYQVIMATQFPKHNAPAAYLLERMGYTFIGNNPTRFKTSDLEEKPLICLHSKLEEHFRYVMNKHQEKKRIYQLIKKYK